MPKCNAFGVCSLIVFALLCVILLLGIVQWDWASDAKPWTLGGDCLWDFDRTYIYVLACINAPEQGQYYYILHYFLTLSGVTVYP